MTIRSRFSVLGTSLLSLALLAFAPTTAAEPFSAGPYWQFKAAALNIDDGDEETVQIGLGFGYQFPKGFAFEAEAHRSIVDGSTDTEDYNFDSIAGFIAYRTPTKVFWKLKLGYGASEINFLGPNNNLDGEGQQFGMGVGNKRFEIEWTRAFIQKVDIDMVSFHFRFGPGTK